MPLLSPVRLAARGAMRASQALHSGHMSAVSDVGPMSTFSWRMRYPIFLKNMTDPILADYYYEKMIHAWFADPPSYNYWWCTAMALGCTTGILSRHWFFNPDIYGRRQENKKPLQDRHRQHSYALPYFNHRMRNNMTKYKWCMIDNEPDWADYHPLGYRPNRKQIHRRHYMWCFTVPRYTIEDPLYTSVTHANMESIYQKIGYTKKPKGEDDDED
mmetsp:Transcript_114084/g.207506  ORF Transcript_114084/g.207506 Transcript_114084/m.207506 type:complete len:215 (-) Transcript_114084:177-821(-)